MKCFFCGEEIADNTVVCPWCGRRQQNTNPSRQSSNGGIMKRLLELIEKVLQPWRGRPASASSDPIDMIVERIKSVNDLQDYFAEAIRKNEGISPKDQLLFASLVTMMGRQSIMQDLLYRLLAEMINQREAGAVGAFGGRSIQMDLLLTEMKGLREDMNKYVDYLARRR